MQLNLLGVMLCIIVQETLQQVAGKEPGQLKKLAQLPEFKVKEAGTNTPRIISATKVLDATAYAIYLKIKTQLSGITAFFMIDSNAMGNFMFEKFTKSH